MHWQNCRGGCLLQVLGEYFKIGLAGAAADGVTRVGELVGVLVINSDVGHGRRIGVGGSGLAATREQRGGEKEDRVGFHAR